MLTIINSFFCSISAFFFGSNFAFILFCFASYFLYYFIIRKLNRVTKILYLIFIVLVLSSGIVLSLLPSKENVMSSIVINSYYFGPVELVTFVLLLVSMLFSNYNKEVYNTSNINKIMNNIINEKDTNKNEDKKEIIKKKIKEVKEKKKAVKKEKSTKSKNINKRNNKNIKE